MVFRRPFYCMNILDHLGLGTFEMTKSPRAQGPTPGVQQLGFRTSCLHSLARAAGPCWLLPLLRCAALWTPKSHGWCPRVLYSHWMPLGYPIKYHRVSSDCTLLSGACPSITKLRFEYHLSTKNSKKRQQWKTAHYLHINKRTNHEYMWIHKYLMPLAKRLECQRDLRPSSTKPQPSWEPFSCSIFGGVQCAGGLDSSWFVLEVARDQAAQRNAELCCLVVQ